MALKEILMQRQESLGLNESEFAEHLGISRSMWWLVKSGQRNPGGKFLRAVMRNLPECRLDVMNYMSEKGG
jgi:transcriptional regulator with XRE-family HTH domain